MMKKRWMLSLVLAMTVVLSACGNNGTNSSATSTPSNNSESSQTEEAAVPADEKKDYGTVDLMLDWYPNAVHSYLYVAKEKGFFEEEGVKVNIQTPVNATDPINLAASGAITVGITYQPDVVTAKADQGAPLVSIASIVRSPLNRVVYLPDAGINSPKDLEGKTIGYPGIPLNESIIKTMVTNDGGDPSKVNILDIGFTLSTSLVTKNVDAIVGAYINHEVPSLKHEGYDTNNLSPTDYGVPSYYELVMVTNEDTLSKDKEKLAAFMRGVVKGYTYMEANPEESLNLLLSMQDEANFPLVEEVEQESLDILLDLMKSDDGFGFQKEADWQSTIDWMVNAGLVQNEIAATDLFVNLVE